MSANPPLVVDSDTHHNQSSEVKDAFSASNTVHENENGARKTGNEESAPVTEPALAEKPLVSICVPVAMFGNHVELNHSNNNQPFSTEFQVKRTYINAYYLVFTQSLRNGEGKTAKIARSPPNRKKNRFANISACKHSHFSMYLDYLLEL